MRLLLTLLPLMVPAALYAEEGDVAIVAKPLMADPVSASSIFQLILMLLFVVGLIFFAAWFFRRLGQFGGTGNQVIRYLGGISVGQRERVVLIEVGGTQLLLGVAPGRVEKLHKLDEPIAFDASVNNSPFAQKLAELVKRKESSS